MSVVVHDVRARHPLNREHLLVVAVEHLLLRRQGDRARVFLHLQTDAIDDGRDFSQHARLAPDMVRRAYRLFNPLAKLSRLVEADEPPAASHQRAHVTAEASYPPYLLQLPPAIDDPIRRRIVQPHLHVVGVVTTERPLYFVAVRHVLHVMSPSDAPAAIASLRPPQFSARCRR